MKHGSKSKRSTEGKQVSAYSFTPDPDVKEFIDSMKAKGVAKTWLCNTAIRMYKETQLKLKAAA